MVLPLRATPPGSQLVLTRARKAARRPVRCCVAAASSVEPGPASPRPAAAPALLTASADETSDAATPAVIEVEEPVPGDLLAEFEHKLEADIQTVAATLTAVTGVIIFWRGVWSLLDFWLEDSVFGDICCIIVGLTIVLWIRLMGVKVSPSFWPPG